VAPKTPASNALHQIRGCLLVQQKTAGVQWLGGLVNLLG